MLHWSAPVRQPICVVASWLTQLATAHVRAAVGVLRPPPLGKLNGRKPACAEWMRNTAPVICRLGGEACVSVAKLVSALRRNRLYARPSALLMANPAKVPVGSAMPVGFAAAALRFCVELGAEPQSVAGWCSPAGNGPAPPVVGVTQRNAWLISPFGHRA